MSVASPSVSPLSILVADDEAGIRELLTIWLRRAGHVVDVVANGADAMRLLRLKRFDLAITDVMMPEGDGFEVMTALRKFQPAARVVVVSGGGKYMPGADCLKIARGLGAHAVVMKPFTRAQFAEALESVLPGVGA